jgi:streptogramin lyase
MTADNNGIMWFGSLYSGLLRFVPNDENGDWYRYEMSDTGTESNTIVSLIIRNGDLWFATGYNAAVSGNGTGIHHLVLNQQNQPEVIHYTFRENSTSLTSLRINYIAADLNGGVWFPAYDDPSIAHLKSDGTWEQFKGDQGNHSLGGFGIAGVAVDSKNRVYFAPQNAKPIAYNATLEQWIDLPEISFTEFYYYGVYIDANDGKWFHGAFGIYYLDPDNTVWTRFSSVEHSAEFPDDYIDRVLVDDSGNAWFTARTGLVLMQKALGENDPEWHLFQRDEDSGFSGSYAIYQDDKGQIWNEQKQQYDSETNTWAEVTDTSDFDNRHLRFLNGRIPVTMELIENFPPVYTVDERYMTIDTRGNIYFCGGLGSVNAGIAVHSSVKGDLDLNGVVDLKDVMIATKIFTQQNVIIPDGIIDINGDLKTGIEELIFMIQSSAQIR